jgi:cold shock protein
VAQRLTAQRNLPRPQIAVDFRGPWIYSRYEERLYMAATSGTIKRLVRDKGFGFIATGGDEEYFFHSSAVRDTRFDDLREGQTVSFEVGRGPKGPRAENVRLE